MNFQSPTESLNSDSRPDSVLDEQENTCDPPETPLPETESKETDEKLVDPLQISNPPSTVSNAEKVESQDENTAPDAAAKQPSTSENQESRSESKQDSIVVAAAATIPSTETSDEKPSVTTLPSTSSIQSTTTTTVSSVSATVTQESGSAKCESPALTVPTYAPKEQEMLSTIANIKQEANVPPTSTDYSVKEVPIYIKKEPSEETADNSSNTNSNSNEPADLKMTVEIKAESKCGLDLSDHENKYQESSSMPPNLQMKFGGPPTTESQNKYPSDSVKYSEPLKYGPPLHGHVLNPAALKYGPPGSELGKFHIDAEGKYEAKPFLDPVNKYPDPSIRPYPSEGAGGDGPHMLKTYPSEPTDLKYSSSEIQAKYTPPVSESIKYEGGESSIIKRPPYPEPHQPIRSPYDPSQMIKYGDPMQKFHGLPPPIGAVGLPDMKYLPPADLKYRPPENLIKTQFTADNLIKTSSYGEYPGSMKYPPTESPIDASARSTPNQDSQSSNSNLPPQLPPPPHGSISSPQTNSPHMNHSAHLPPTTGPPLLIGAPGIPPSPLAHLPANHPSMMPPHSSPSTTPVSSHGPLHLPPSTASSPMQQPLGLVTQGSITSAGIMPPTGPPLHPGLHRPHQDIPPLMHHPSAVFSTGLPPPHSSCHPQIPSPALSVSRGEHERHEQRRIEALHGSSPGLLPPGPGAQLLGHPSMPLHLPSNLPPSAIPLLPPHHPGHLGPPLLPPSASNAPLSLIGPPISTSASISDRRTPTSAPPSSSSHSTAPITSSAFSRTSPSVQFSNLPPTGHRPVSPSQPPPSSLTRASPLHLTHHSSASALNAAAVAAAERDRHALMRQQSPHMTPPPVSSSSLIASPLSKMFGAQTQQPRSSPPPSHHLRPGASPPVMRHPQMPLPLPLMGPAPGMPPQMGMHPAHNPYSHHLIHPMFYPHQPNPFNSPYHAYPYGHPGFQYIKPPHGPGIDPSVLQPHPSATARLEETAAHVEKQMNSANSQNAKVTL